MPLLFLWMPPMMKRKVPLKKSLLGHLSSPDFFDIANNPTASFVISSVEGNTAKGTLTIRGKANEETLTNVTLTEADGH
ncbi:MAG: YceI family protein [Bacteroidetes bacterium]|nr:YceI family protein [Bacteroidota bacterium]